MARWEHIDSLEHLITDELRGPDNMSEESEEGETVEEGVDVGTETDGASPESKIFQKPSSTSSIVTTVAFCLGVKDESMKLCYSEVNSILLDTLYASKEACVVRYLCKIRTLIFKNYSKIDYLLKYELKNLPSIDLFNVDEINKLEKWGIPVVQANFTSQKYAEHITHLINKNIPDCKDIFPDWVNFDFIKSLYVITKDSDISKQCIMYQQNKKRYPFQMYMHWNPEPCGNILFDDKKFLEIIYRQHGSIFWDKSKTVLDNDAARVSLAEFLDQSQKCMIVVDCENADPYKLLAMLFGLSPAEQSCIGRIVLYDDVHTTPAWKLFDKYFPGVEFERIVVDRLVAHKSLVDLKLTAGVCQAFYRDDYDAFVLCSSDSDFWALIDSLSDARFLVLYEYSKAGAAIKEALVRRGVYHYATDDFNSGSSHHFVTAVLKSLLKQHIPELIGKNAWALTQEIYDEAHLDFLPISEKKAFYNKYVANLRLTLDPSGCFTVDVD